MFHTRMKSRFTGIVEFKTQNHASILIESSKNNCLNQHQYAWLEFSSRKTASDFDSVYSFAELDLRECIFHFKYQTIFDRSHKLRPTASQSGIRKWIHRNIRELCYHFIFILNLHTSFSPFYIVLVCIYKVAL